MQEPSGCTPKKRRRRSLRNLRRQTISAGGEDGDTSLLLGSSTVQDPAAEVDEEYGSLWLELDNFDSKPRAKMKGSKRTGRRSSFGIVQDGRPVLPLWDQPAPYLPQPESVRFAHAAGEASPQMSPAFQVDRAGPWKNIDFEEDVHDTSLNTAFSKFNIRSEDHDVLGEMQMRETENSGDSLYVPYSNPDPVHIDLEGPEHFQSPSPVPCEDLQAPGGTAEDPTIQSPGRVPPEVSDISEWERWQRENRNSSNAIQDYTSPQNRSSFLTKLSNNFREVTHGVESSPLNTPPSSNTKAHFTSDLSPGGLSTSSVEATPRVHREQKNTAYIQCGKHVTSQSEPDVAVNLDSLKLDTSIGSIDEEQGEGKVDFDLIFDSPCLAPSFDQDKCAEVDSPLQSAQPAIEHQDTEDSSASCSKPLPPSGVGASSSPLAVPLKSSPKNTGRNSSPSGKTASQGLKADEEDIGGDEGKTEEPAASIVIEKPRQLRRSRRAMDLTQVPELLEAPMQSDTQALREAPPAGSWDSHPTQSPGTKRRLFIHGRRRSGSLAPLFESADEKSDAESAGSASLPAGLEGDSTTTPSASSLTNSPGGSAPPTASGTGRYQKRKRASTDLRLVLRKTGSDPKQDVTMTDTDRGSEFHQGCVCDKAEGKAKTDASLPEGESLAEEGTTEQSSSWPDLVGAASAGKKQPKKRKRELLEILATKENMDTENPEVDEEMANLNESRARRRRRRSFSIPQEPPSSESADITMADISEGDTAVRVGVKRCKSRELDEKELEDLYRNKNYKLPELRTWETIFESLEEEGSSEAEPLMSKRRYKRVITFSDKDPVKARKRLSKAVRKGWTPHKKLKVTNDDVQQRLDRLEAALNRAEDIW